MIVVVGDVKPKAVRALVDKYWGGWKRGSYKPEIPVEPPQEAPRNARSRLAGPDAADGHGRASRARPTATPSKDTAALDALVVPRLLANIPTSTRSW